MRHQNAAQRPRQVTGHENAEALQQAQPLGHFGREKQLAEGQREEHEDDEVVDLQRAAQRRKGQGAVIAAMQTRRAGSSGGRHGAGSAVRQSAAG